MRGAYGNTPLHWVAPHNANPAVMALLLDRGAAVDARNEKGETPLHRAAHNANPAVMALLLDRGAATVDVGSEKGETPLHEAAAHNANPAVTALLLDRGGGGECAEQEWLHAFAPGGV